MDSRNADTPQAIGKYRVERLLGRGAYGRVYLAVHPELQANRAIKLLDPEVSGPSGLEEAVLQASLEHPNIIQIHDVGRHDGCLFMVSEYAPGGSLTELLSAGAPDHQLAADIARQVLAALALAHGRGVVHRDLKPDNILFRPGPDGKGCRLRPGRRVGQIRPRRRAGGGFAWLHGPGAVSGSLVSGQRCLGRGCLLAHMLGGRAPFDSVDEFQALTQARQGPARLLDELRGKAPQPLLEVLGRLLEPSPDNRPQSAQDAAGLLELARSRITAKASLETIHLPTMEADDWSVFRAGPGRSGAVCGDLADELTEAWQYHAGVPVFSSPAVSRGAVFFGDNSGWLTALDMLSGRLMWRWQGPSPAFAQPVAAAGVVAACWYDGTVRVFDADSGQIIWQAKPGGEIWAGPQVGDDGLAVACLDGRAFVLDGRDGSVLRQWDLGQAIEAEPLLLGGRMILAGRDGLLMAVDPANGAELWRKNIGGALEAAPAGQDAKVYCNTLEGLILCLSAEDGAILWKKETGQMLAAGGALGEDCLALASVQGGVCLLSSADGAVLWQVQLPEAVTAPLAMTAGQVVVCGRQGKIYLLDLKDGKLRQRLDTQGSFGAGPAVWRRMLVDIDTSGLARLWRSGGEAIGDDQ